MRAPEQAPEHFDVQPQDGARGLDVRARAGNVGGRYLTTADVADELHYTGTFRIQHAWRFIKDKGIPRFRRGKRTLLIRRTDFIAAIEGKH